MALMVFLSLLVLSTVMCNDDESVQSLTTLVLQQAALIQQQAATIQALQSRVASLESNQQHSISDLNAKLSTLTTQLTTRVYYRARISNLDINIGSSNSPIKFDSVMENVGNAYNPQTGVFTAPVSGVYVFYAQLMKDSARNNHIHYAMDMAGTVLCMNSLDATNDYDKSSCMAATHVQKGQAVFVRREDGDFMVEGSWWCYFAGVLISADA